MSDETSPALKALLDYGQADEDGVMCVVSRQAVHEVADELATLRTRLAEATAENERLREALTPFSQYAAAFEAKVSTLFADDDPIWYCPQVAPLTIGDMRRARAALAQTKEPSHADEIEARIAEAVAAERERARIKAVLHSNYPISTDWERGYNAGRIDAAKAIMGEPAHTRDPDALRAEQSADAGGERGGGS